MECEKYCLGFKRIGREACCGCSGMTPLELATMKTITLLAKGLRADGRCKHGMLPGQCSYCVGIKMPKYAQSVGAAFIRR
jgi:hypothetical protein